MADEQKWELPHDQEFEDGVLKALGWMVIQSDMLEYSLADLYWLSSQKSWEDAREDLRGKTLGQVCDLAVAAYARQFPTGQLHGRLEDLAPALKGAIETRNQFVHASWSFDHTTRVMHRHRLPKGVRGAREYRLFSVPEIAAASDLVGDMAERVYDELYDPGVEAKRPTTS